MLLKYLIFSCVLAFSLISCGREKIKRNNDLEVTIEDEKMLLGKIDRNAFELKEYKSWFDSTYQAYTPIATILDTLETLSSDLEIAVVMGSWCSDSQRDVPALYRILDLIRFDKNKLNVIATDRSKTMPEPDLKDLDIEYVPTIILKRSNEELGRIIEFPERTLEEDMLAILIN